jgi:hypothetical protein
MSAANDGLQYPTTFQEFMGVVDRWHRAREPRPNPGESLGGMLLRTADELDDAVGIFRQVWAHAEAGRTAGVAPPDGGQQG